MINGLPSWLTPLQTFALVASPRLGLQHSACNDSCALGKDCSTIANNDSYNNTHTYDSSNRGERPSRKPNALVQCAQRIGGSSDG